MTKPKDKKKPYEPPVIKEVGGVFEQAMGISACTTGNFFSTDPCSRGTSPGGEGCTGGSLDQACAGGGSDNTGCSRGFFVTGGGCTPGTGGG